MDRFEKIKSFKDEVREFHPALKELFKRLPNINSVEYTHGPHEMGADFILSKYDETLSRIEYIGVIVKVGKIKQNHSDIDAQILECELERKVEGGKKKIYITEIWVLTNDSISNQAQSKIHHKYNNKKINFVNGNDVTGLFNRYYLEFWTDVSVEVGAFLRLVSDESSKLTKTIDILDTSSYDDVYIPQYLTNISDNIYSDPGRNKPLKKLNINSILNEEKLVFIEGSMGTGKSRLIAKITEEYSTNESFNTRRTLPYVVSIKEYLSVYGGEIKQIIKHIEDCVSVDGVNFLIMLDAVDEIDASESEVVSLLENIYVELNSRSDCKVIVTSRPFDNPTVETEIDKYFKRFLIHPLTSKQIVSIVENICKRYKVENHLISELEKSSLFKVLPKTPISAIILGKLLRQDVQEVPSTMTELYSKYTELTLGRWDVDKGLQSQNEYDVSHNVTINLAKYFLDNELEKVAINEVKDMFNEYASSRKLLIDEDRVFDKLISNTEIFRINESSKTMSFIHRTFAEYFYACHMSRENDAVISQDIYNVYWNNTFFFYFGIKRDCPELIKAISEISFTQEEAKVSQMFSNGNLLLAAYLTPYDVIEKSIYQSFGDAAKFFNDVSNNKISSVLSVLSKMHLLSIFAYSMSDTYGYDFFIEALESRSLEISCITNPSDEQYAELFLLNSALLSINKFNAFDLMIKNYGKKIPEVLQVGINHSIDNKKASPVVKKYVKMHMKRVNKNRSLYDSIIDLYEKPIDVAAAESLKKKLTKALN